MERWAVVSGNANDPATWDGGTLPLVTDDVYSNGFTVTITANATFSSVHSNAGSTAVDGGQFVINDGVTLTANVFAGTNPGVSYAGVTSATIIGDCTGGVGNGSGGATSTGTGVLIVQGTAIGSTTGTGPGAYGNNQTNPSASPIRINAARFGPTGAAPTVGLVVFASNLSATFEVRNAALATKTLTTYGSPVERWAIASGNASDPAIWNGGTLPDINDDVYANGFTVTINVSVTFGSVRTTAGVTAVAGGGFTLNDGITLTANVIAGTTRCITTGGPIGFASYIIGNITGGTATNARGVHSSTAGTVTITGNVTGGSAASTEGAYTVAGTVNIIGNVLGGSAGGGVGASPGTSGGGTVNVTGTVTAGSGSACYGIFSGASAPATVNVTGNVFGSASSSAGIAVTGPGVVTVNGNVTAGSSTASYGVTNSIGTVIVNGNVTGGSLGIGANLTAAGTVTINGDCIGGDGATAYGAQVGGSVVGQLTVTGAAVGSATGAGTPGVNSVGTTPAIISKAKYGPTGASPCKGLVLMYPLYKSTVEVRNAALATQLLKFPLVINAGFPLSRLVR